MKRLLGGGALDLRRLERICELLDIDFFELARRARGTRDGRVHLTEAQEERLALDPGLLAVFHLLCNEWTVDAVGKEFGLDGIELVRRLAALDRLGLVELLPRNRVRLRVPRDFAWRPGGPVLRRYLYRALQEFLRGEFDADGWLGVEVRELGEASREQLRRRMERLAAEFGELAELDASLPPERRRSVGMVVAIRPWIFSVYDALREESALPAARSRRAVGRR